MERYYSNNGKTYAVIEGRNNRNGKTIFCVYYDGWYSRIEQHEIKQYEWAKHLHGNAPSGTAYGYFNASKTGERIIITA